MGNKERDEQQVKYRLNIGGAMAAKFKKQIDSHDDVEVLFHKIKNQLAREVAIMRTTTLALIIDAHPTSVENRFNLMSAVELHGGKLNSWKSGREHLEALAMGALAHAIHDYLKSSQSLQPA